jgi:hypothetical protein
MFIRYGKPVFIAFIGFILITGCASLPKDFDRPESYALDDTDDTLIARTFANELSAHPGESGFVPLESGLDAFVARAVLANGAEQQHRCPVLSSFTTIWSAPSSWTCSSRRPTAESGSACWSTTWICPDGIWTQPSADSHPEHGSTHIQPVLAETHRSGPPVSDPDGIAVTRRMPTTRPLLWTIRWPSSGAATSGTNTLRRIRIWPLPTSTSWPSGMLPNDVSTAFRPVLEQRTGLSGNGPQRADRLLTPEEIETNAASPERVRRSAQEGFRIPVVGPSKLEAGQRSPSGITSGFFWGTSDVIYDEPEKLLSDEERKRNIIYQRRSHSLFCRRSKRS